MKNKICEFCGGEFKNLIVHQRFCKKRKEALENTKANNIMFGKKIKVTEEDSNMEDILVVNKENIQSAPIFTKEISEEERKKIEQERKIKEWERKAKERERKARERGLGIDIKEAARKIEILKEDSEENQLQENIYQTIPGFQDQKVIEFNESGDTWEQKLASIFESIPSRQTIYIKLLDHLAHEFIDILGVYKYPSDRFMNIIYTYCSEWKESINEKGGQTFICTRK